MEWNGKNAFILKQSPYNSNFKSITLTVLIRSKNYMNLYTYNEFSITKIDKRCYAKFKKIQTKVFTVYIHGLFQDKHVTEMPLINSL